MQIWLFLTAVRKKIRFRLTAVESKLQTREPKCIFEDEEGELGDIFQDEMPFDMNAPVIDILPEDYGIWFVDAMDNPEITWVKPSISKQEL